MITDKNGSVLANNNKRYAFRTFANPVLEHQIIDSESNDGTGKVVANAVFQKCDDANANGHRFSKRVLANAVQNIQPEVRDRHFVGELDHPDDIADVNRIANVNFKEASHVITELKMDGDYVIGKFETISGTPNGDTLAALLKANIKVGVSIRAITDQDISYGLDNVDEIQEFTLITYDAVHNPAYADAYVKSIVSNKYQNEYAYTNAVLSSVHLLNNVENGNLYEAKEPNGEYIKLTKNDLSEIIASSIKNYKRLTFKK